MPVVIMLFLLLLFSGLPAPAQSAMKVETITVNEIYPTGLVENRNATYEACHNGSVGFQAVLSNATYPVECGHEDYGSFYWIHRCFFTFDTTFLKSYSQVTEASLQVRGSGYVYEDFTVKLQKWTDEDGQLTVNDYSAFDGINYDDNSFGADDFTYEWNKITIRDETLIQKNGYTKICMRLDKEIEADPPDGMGDKFIFFWGYEGAYARLEIKYVLGGRAGGDPPPKDNNPISTRDIDMFVLGGVSFLSHISCLQGGKSK